MQRKKTHVLERLERTFVPHYLQCKWRTPYQRRWALQLVHCMGPTLTRRDRIRFAVSCLHRVLCVELRCQAPMDLLCLRNEDIMEAVVRLYPRSTRRYGICSSGWREAEAQTCLATIALERFLTHVVWPVIGGPRPSLHSEPGLGRPPPACNDLRVVERQPPMRDHFTQSEVDVLLRPQTGRSNRDDLVLRILAETGLHSGILFFENLKEGPKKKPRRAGGRWHA